MLKTEVRLAILTMGLDPWMGILHADLKSWDSFVFDVIESLRPVVDGYLLTMLEERTFTAREFFETWQGVSRLLPPLPQALAEMAPRLAKLVASCGGTGGATPDKGTGNGGETIDRADVADPEQPKFGTGLDTDGAQAHCQTATNRGTGRMSGVWGGARGSDPAVLRRVLTAVPGGAEHLVQ